MSRRRQQAARAMLDLVALVTAVLDALPGPAGAAVTVATAPDTLARLHRAAGDRSS